LPAIRPAANDAETRTNPQYILIDCSETENSAAMNIDIAASDKNTIVVAVIKMPSSKKLTSSGGRKKKAKPMISVAVTVGGHSQSSTSVPSFCFLNHTTTFRSSLFSHSTRSSLKSLLIAFTAF